MRKNHLIGQYPVIGIRPTIDGRRGAMRVRESIEEKTMDMAKSAAKLFEENLRYADGTPVTFDRIIGRPVMHIPLLGYVSHFVQNPPGVYIVIMVLAMLVLLTFMPDILLGFMTPQKNETEESSHEEEIKEQAELLAEIDAIRKSINESGQAQAESPPAEEAPAEDSESSN